MMIKKLFALTMMLFYLSAAFGVVLGQASCCEESGMVETMECHDPVLPIQPSSLHFSEDCPVCLAEDVHTQEKQTPVQHEHHEQAEDCCADCDSLYFSVQKDNLAEQLSAIFAASLNLQKLQAAFIVLPWIVDYFSLIPLLEEINTRPESPLLASAKQVPIFIRDCTYRI